MGVSAVEILVLVVLTLWRSGFYNRNPARNPQDILSAPLQERGLEESASPVQGSPKGLKTKMGHVSSISLSLSLSLYTQKNCLGPWPKRSEVPSFP